MKETYATLTVHLSTSLRERARKIAKKRRTTTVQLIRDALEEKIEQLEVKDLESNDQKKRKISSIITPLVGLDQRPIVELPTSEVPDRLAKLFDEHAARILAVATQPELVKVREREAFTAIKRMAPLSYADDQKIVSRLEGLIAIKVANEPEPERVDFTPSLGVSSLRPVDEPVPVATPDLKSFLAPLAQLFQGAQTTSEPDELTGKSIRVKTRKMIETDNDEETP